MQSKVGFYGGSFRKLGPHQRGSERIQLDELHFFCGASKVTGKSQKNNKKAYDHVLLVII